MKSWLWAFYYYPVPIWIFSWAFSEVLPKRRLARWFLWLPTALLAVSALGYLFYGTYFDQIESGIVSKAWRISKGELLYLPLGSAERTSYVYGPIVFGAQYFLMSVLGPSVFTSKLLGIFSLAATCWLASRWRHTPLSWAFFAASIFAFGPVSFYARVDAVLLLSVTAACFACSLLARGWQLTLVLAIALGVGANCKPNGFLYFLPAAVVLCDRGMWRELLAASALSAGVFALSFVVVPGAEFSTWLELVLTATRNGPRTSGTLLIQNLQWLALLIAPVFLVLKVSKRSLWFLSALALSGVGAALVGARPSASASHLLPVASSAALGFFHYPARANRRWGDSVTFASTLALTWLGGWALAYQVQFAQKTFQVEMPADLQSLIGETAQRPVAYAFGGNDYFKLASGMLRPVVVFSSHGANFFELPAAGEMQLSQIPMAQATRDFLAQCRIPFWIASRGVDPFSGSEVYGDLGKLFSVHYTRSKQSKYFDLWECRESCATKGFPCATK